MKTFIKLTIIDYLTSWTIAAELCLLLAFLFLAAYSNGPTQALTALGIVGLFSLLLIPISVRRITNRAWSGKSRYLIAANLRRRPYLLGLATVTFIVDVIILLIVFATYWIMNIGAFDLAGTAKSFALLAAIVALNISVCLILSKFSAPRVGVLLAPAIIILLGFADEKAFNSAPAKAVIRIIQTYGPHLKSALDALSRRSAPDWPLTVLQLGAYAFILTLIATMIFESKDLIFED